MKLCYQIRDKLTHIKTLNKNMPILNQWELPLNIDDVLRAQGADPDTFRLRRPSLVNRTEEAIAKGLPLLHPLVLYEKYSVKGLIHERLELTSNSSRQDKSYLSGQLVAQHLARAQMVVIMICTIGSELDESVSSYFKIDPMVGFALDGVGSAAVEMLAIQACNYFETLAKEDGLNTTMPLNPGMVGWPLDQGQPQIFTLLDSDQIQVSLTESCMMTPSKSLSMVLGVGHDVSAIGSSCDYCSLKGVCKYQNHYAK
jgi:hypothetical protein